MFYSSIGLLALMVLLIENQDILWRRRGAFESRAWSVYRRFLYAVLVYYVADISWGLFDSLKIPQLIFLVTTLYFAAIAAGILFWTKYTILYLEEENVFGKIFIWAGRITAALTWFHLGLNFFTPVMFYVDGDGTYHARYFRYAILAVQIALLILLSAYALRMLLMHRSAPEKKIRCRILAIFGLVMGVFLFGQLLYVYLPLYSVAYLLGTSLLRISIIGNEKAQYHRELEEATRIAELKQSITSLLDNMPALSFSKDANTGVYLACNQAFAEYAGKSKPEEVAGHTDFEIFDEQTAAHFVEDDKKALAMKEPYVLYEDVADANGNPKQFQTTKLKFHDTSGRLCLLGMSMDVTEMEKVRREREQAEKAYREAMSAGSVYADMVEALSEDYFNLYSVDLETDNYVEYGSVTESKMQLIGEEKKDFFRKLQETAPNVVYPDDLEEVLETVNKEKLLAAIEKDGIFRYEYRLMIDGVPTYVNMKATRNKGDENHVIIGVNNVDSLVKARMEAERVKEEEKTYLRLNALNRNMLVLYIVDSETEEYTEFTSSEDFEKLGLAKQGKDFFKVTQENANWTINPEDRPMFHANFTKENVLKTIRQDGDYTIEYRMMAGELPAYVRLKVTEIEEEGRKQLIIGLFDVTAQVKYEQSVANELTSARKMANVDALTGVKNKHAYGEWEEELNRRIESGEQEPFGIVVCDINNMKLVNDIYGHAEGDACIRKASRMICHIFAHSPVFRIGGDEFAVMLFGEDYSRRWELLDELNALPKNPSEIKPGDTISAGISEFEAGSDSCLMNVFERADTAMYERKRYVKSLIK